MPKKIRFRPRITRVKMNPEQVVLFCTCYAPGIDLNVYFTHEPRNVYACAMSNKGSLMWGCYTEGMYGGS